MTCLRCAVRYCGSQGLACFCFCHLLTPASPAGFALYETCIYPPDRVVDPGTGGIAPGLAILIPVGGPA